MIRGCVADSIVVMPVLHRYRAWVAVNWKRLRALPSGMPSTYPHDPIRITSGLPTTRQLTLIRAVAEKIESNLGDAINASCRGRHV
jgi:hypothetical protein